MVGQINQYAKSFLSRIVRIGEDPNDDDDLRLKKSLLVVCSLPFAIIAIFWGLIYVIFQEPLSGVIPLSYSIISLISIFHFGFTRRYRFFRFSQLLLILVLPFLLMHSLGGFVYGSAVILWALVCPLGALLFDEPGSAPKWFIAYVILLGLSGFLPPNLGTPNNLPASVLILFFVINLVGVGSFVFVMVSYFVNQKTIFQEKSESLLLNILPHEIAKILKNDSRTIADSFEGASILFADVVNFTPLSSTLKPTEVVELLNEVFTHFDSLVDEYGLEKIKTIGDCYMVASGVPRPSHEHAQKIVGMALEMRDYVLRNKFFGHQLIFRMGINSGPVVAGVIGRKKFIYDLWGDAVNTASRMESQGQEGAIQIARATYELIKNDFFCEPQGHIDIKGKGKMEVWHVIGYNQEGEPYRYQGVI